MVDRFDHVVDALLAALDALKDFPRQPNCIASHQAEWLRRVIQQSSCMRCKQTAFDVGDSD